MKQVKITLNGTETELSPGLTRAADLYESAGLQPDKQRLYLDRPNDIDVPLNPDDHLIIRGGEKIVSGPPDAAMGDNPPLRNPPQVTLNGKPAGSFETAKIRAVEICRLDAELESASLFVDVEGGVDIHISNEITLVLQEGERYLTIPAIGDDLVIDVRECGKHNRKPPKGQWSYKIMIDRKPYTVSQSEMAGTEILNLAGKTPDEWTLDQKLHGGRRIRIEPDQPVDFTQPGIERFETVPKQAQQG